MTRQNPPPPPGGYWDLRPDVAVSPEMPPASSTATTERALRARLAVLDHLYESNAITCVELSKARKAILGGRVGEGRASLIGADASLFVNGVDLHAQTPAGPTGPPPPTMHPTERIGPLRPPEATKVAGLPVWAAAAVAAALVVVRAAPAMPALWRRI